MMPETQEAQAIRKEKWKNRLLKQGIRLNVILLPERDDIILKHLIDYPFPDTVSEVRSIMKKFISGFSAGNGNVLPQFVSSRKSEEFVADIQATKQKKNSDVKSATDKLKNLEF